MGQIEAWVNADEDLAHRIRYFMGVPGPDLATAAQAFSTSFGSRAQGWVVDMMRAQIAGSGVKSGLRVKHDDELGGPTPDVPAVVVPQVPDSRPYPDEFYRDVAAAYRAHAMHHRNPSAMIADASGVPITTVHRWVRIARRRGFLPPGQPGKVG